jgi:geranylgeranyl diphosphate synthase type II
MSYIQEYFQHQGKLIEEQLNRLVPQRRSPHENLFEAARYALLGGGKRLRPIFTLTTTRILGGDISNALSPACALEMIHTYSLIHDDLPCMDDDDYRRGQLTVHRKYSEGHAVLTGDYLLTYAFEVIAADPNLDNEKKVQLITILARQSGSEGMIGGQVMDLASQGNKIPLETLKLLHRKKSGALISAAIEFGAIIGNATPHQFHCLQRFGENIGLAFQIVDDILDITASEAKHGKAISSDFLNDKTTYVTLLGLDQAQAAAKNFYDQAITALKPLPHDTSLLTEIANFIIHRSH